MHRCWRCRFLTGDPRFFGPVPYCPACYEDSQRKTCKLVTDDGVAFLADSRLLSEFTAWMTEPTNADH